MIKVIFHTCVTVVKGLRMTLKHLLGASHARREVDIRHEGYFAGQEGITTIQYPRQELPIPEVARYQLDVEMDDCIVCDLCAKACPVDCIAIESIKATAPIGKTSDGSIKRLYAARFDIDMAKCMYCGLCTVVCPTECITMTNQYDRSMPDLKGMLYQFATMTPEEAAEKRTELTNFQAEKGGGKQIP